MFLVWEGDGGGAIVYKNEGLKLELSVLFCFVYLKDSSVRMGHSVYNFPSHNKSLMQVVITNIN